MKTSCNTITDISSYSDGIRLAITDVNELKNRQT